MAVWRVKAYEMFGFRRGRYSHRWGVADLLADLRMLAAEAISRGDAALIDRIFEYVLWANAQRAENLRAAVDVAFFLPLLSNEATAAAVRDRLPGEVLGEKLSMPEPKSGGQPGTT